MARFRSRPSLLQLSVAALAVLASATAALWSARGESESPSRPTRVAAAARQPQNAQPAALPGHGYLGTTSCTASNCHGGAKAGTTVGNEYTIWIQKDPHATAFTTLYSRESQQIAARLNLGPAYQAQVCLDCHTLNPHDFQRGFHDLNTVQDGVTCEHCHGPAERWIEPHKRADWKLRSEAEKASLGFRNTEDLLARTRACVECHVGAPGRDVNHDLIAAGHPRLYFEMSAYHANMPRHWSRSKDLKQNSPALEARLWAIGQVAMAEAALGLLADRAGNVDGVWPEFAEYGCFACHHDLSAPSWRQNRGSSHRPGEYPWGTWHFPLLARLANEVGGVDAARLEGALASLDTSMRRPAPDRAKVAAEAEATRVLVSDWAEQLNAMPFSPELVDRLLVLLAGESDAVVGSNWDGAAQVYLGAVALHLARADLGRSGGAALPDGAVISQNLHGIRSFLQFSTSGAAERYASPKTFDQPQIDDIRARLHQIRQLVENP